MCIRDSIYAEGCKWLLVDPPPGPTVDDLVSAYAKLPGFGATPARYATVDGFVGKQIEYTVPDYNEDECVGGKFEILQADHTSGLAPSPWAHAPNQQEVGRSLRRLRCRRGRQRRAVQHRGPGPAHATRDEARAVIEQAKGIIMEREHCGPDHAFTVLTRTSQTRNVNCVTSLKASSPPPTMRDTSSRRLRGS